MRNSMHGGGGTPLSGVITTTSENHVVSYMTFHNYSTSVDATSISLKAIRVK